MLLGTVITNMATRLANVAPTKKGRRAVAENDTVPRYVWVRKTLGPTGQNNRIGGATRTFFEDGHLCEIHCWGKDEDDCERLRQAFITALRLELTGGPNM